MRKNLVSGNTPSDVTGETMLHGNGLCNTVDSSRLAGCLCIKHKHSLPEGVLGGRFGEAAGAVGPPADFLAGVALAMGPSAPRLTGVCRYMSRMLVI